MTHEEFQNCIELQAVNGVFVPCSEEAFKVVYQNEGQTILLKTHTPRDLSLHKCYHLFCRWLWDKMPLAFKKSRCPDPKNMYQYLKIISGQYSEAMQYKDKTFYSFESISFGRMSNEEFKSFLEDQMASIYTELLVPLNMAEIYEEMEQEFKKIFKELL